MGIPYEELENNLFNASIEPETLKYDQDAKKWYFKGFLMNNKINRRKFGIIDPEVIDRDIDTFIGLPLTEVEQGIRKGDHAQPEDAGIIESKEPSKFDFVNKAINYYRDFAKAKIINIFRPDRNLFNASRNNPNVDLTWYAQYETSNEDLARRIEAAKIDPVKNKVPRVSPSVYGVKWHYNDKKEIIVDQFVGTHVGIVDKGAYGDVAYITPEVCKVDGKTCYYKLLDASDLVENINSNVPKPKDMSEQSKQGLGLIEKAIFNTAIPNKLEDWLNSGYALEVVDTNKIDFNSIQNQANGEYVIFKKTGNNNNNPVNNNNNMSNNQTSQPQNTQAQQPANQTPNIQTSNIPSNANASQYVHINDVNAAIEKAKTDLKAEMMTEFKSILEEKNKENTKANILTKYFDSLANQKELSGKIDMDKINAEKEKYSKLPVDPETLETILANSIFHPKNSSSNNFISKFGLPTSDNDQANKGGQDQNNQGNNSNAGQGNQSDTRTISKNIQIKDSVTNIPPKGNGEDNLANFMGNPTQAHNQYRQEGDLNPNGSTLNNLGEFKSSDSHQASSYSDEYKKNSFNASDNTKRGHDITGDSIPKKFQHLIGNGIK